MFSLHVDTARTWRGGQNQVLLTVNGLRAIGHRAALVAHPGGELRRRAAEGLELIPIAPRTEMDLSAAWRFSRHRQAAGAGRHPRPRPARRRDGGAGAVDRAAAAARGGRVPALVASRRVDFHLKGNSLSRWKYRQVDCFIAASEAIRQMLVADGVPANRTVTVHEGIDVEHVLAAPPVNVHEAFWLPHARRSSATWRRSCRTRGSATSSKPRIWSCSKMPDARFIILGEGELREQLERQVHEHHLEKHVLLPGFRTDVLGCIKGFDLFVDELGHRRTRHLAARRDGLRAADRRDARPAAFPEIVEDGVNGLLVPPRDRAGAGARHRATR